MTVACWEDAIRLMAVNDGMMDIDVTGVRVCHCMLRFFDSYCLFVLWLIDRCNLHFLTAIDTPFAAEYQAVIQFARDNCNVLHSE